MLLAVVVLSGVGCERTTRDTDIKLFSVGEVKSLWDKRQSGQEHALLLVDPRTPKAFNAGHIPGARNLTLPRINVKAERDPTIEKFDNIVVYGDDPGDPTARGMTKRLMEAGYSHVRLFAGGLLDWIGRSYPVDNSPAVPETPAQEPK
jgi:rhodanese-related sulfurtransferase